MTRPSLLLAILTVASASSDAFAQTPPPAAAPDNPTVPVPPGTPRMVDPYLPRTIARRAPRSRTSPEPSYRAPQPYSPHTPAPADDSDYGFRNPGGIGRMDEFYPPGNTFQQQGHDPTPVARFGQGGGAPDRQEQLQAQQVGINRQNEYDNRINALARPAYGYGYGFGFGYGLGFGGFPY